MDESTFETPSTVSSYILFGVVALAPLPFGSTQPGTIALWCIILGIAAVTASPKWDDPRQLGFLLLAAMVVAAYAFLIHEQLSSTPWLASPNPIWTRTANALGVTISPQVSIARNQPFFAIGAPLANLLAGVCSLIICSNRHRAHQLFLVVAWSGVAYAIYGIAAFIIDPTSVLWQEKVAYRDVLTATFVNRNTTAVYFGTCSVLWALFLCQQIRRHLLPGKIDWKSLLQLALNDPPRAVLLPLVMMVPCLAAMLMTNSRAGVVFSLAAIVLACTVSFSRDVSSRAGILAIAAVGAVFMLLLLQVLGGNIGGRFDTEGFSGEGRIETYRSTLKLIMDHPWFGTGLGTFAWSFPAYRSPNISMWGIWSRAHSTPLELAAELGLPLAALTAFAWSAVLAVLARGVAVRRRDRVLPIGGLAIALLALAHSCVDFSLQIPGYSIVVFALTGAGLAGAFPSKDLQSKV